MKITEILAVSRVALLTAAMSVFLSGCATSTPNGDSGPIQSPAPSAVADPGVTAFVQIESQEYSINNRPCGDDGGVGSDATLEIVVQLRNVSGQEIKAVKASAIILDSFGEEIWTFGLDEDRRVKDGDTFRVGSYGGFCWELNEWDEVDRRLLDMDDLYSQSSLEVVISKIAFMNGDVVEF